MSAAVPPCEARMFIPPDTALQMDKGNLSCFLHSQKSRQVAFNAELSR